MRPRLLLVLFAAALLLGAAPAPTVTSALPDLEERLRQAVAGGSLDEAQALLYRLYAQKAPERLPPELRVTVPAGALRAEAAGRKLHGRCGTLLLREVRAKLATLPADVRAEAESLLRPPRAARRESTRAGRAVVHELGNWVTTEHFSIEWGSDLTNEDGTRPVRDADGDQIPDVIELWARYFEAVYRKEIVELGCGDLANAATLAQQLIPVYVANSEPSVVWEDLSPGVYAVTDEGLPYDPTPWIVVSNNFSLMPPNDDPEGKLRGAMKVTAAHEFFHVVQFLMPLPRWPTWDWNADSWWLEGSAVWFEDEVFGEVNDYLQYLEGANDWPSYLEKGLVPTEVGGSWTYGAAILGKYLSEHAGGAAVMIDVWARIRAGTDPLTALDAYATSAGFAGLNDLYQGFAGANAAMDYREGSRFGSVPVRSPSLDYTGPVSVPEYLGATYLRRATGTGSGLSVQLTGAQVPGTSSMAWGVSACVLRDAGYSVVVGDFDPAGAPSVGVSRFGLGDVLYAIPTFLAPGRTAQGFTTRTAAGPTGGFAGAVAGLRVDPAAGGLDVSWDPVAGSAGYVVRWRPAASVAYTGSRTLYGPVTRAELRGLPGNQVYDVQVFAYGGAADEDLAGAATATQTAGSGATTATPEVPMTLGSGPTGGGSSGGGGGGGCFLTLLGS